MPSRRSPVELQVRTRLEELRGAGVSFSAAWVIAVGSLRFASGPERDDWMAALAGTRAAWEAAYTRAPITRPQQAAHSV
jgi:hypothetical protein